MLKLEQTFIPFDAISPQIYMGSYLFSVNSFACIPINTYAVESCRLKSETINVCGSKAGREKLRRDRMNERHVFIIYLFHVNVC